MMFYFDVHTHSVGRFPASEIVSLNVDSGFIASEIIYASVGIHPWFLSEMEEDEQWNHLLELVKDKRVIALGEVGLDKLKGPSLEFQKSVFRKEIALSEEMGLPLVIHCVRAFNELLQLRKELKPEQPWIIHGFRGKKEVAEMLLKAGCFLSFGSSFQETALSAVPLNRLFIETDDTAEKIEGLYQRIATVRGEALEELAQGVKKNVKEVFFKA